MDYSPGVAKSGTWLTPEAQFESSLLKLVGFTLLYLIQGWNVKIRNLKYLCSYDCMYQMYGISKDSLLKKKKKQLYLVDFLKK